MRSIPLTLAVACTLAMTGPAWSGGKAQDSGEKSHRSHEKGRDRDQNQEVRMYRTHVDLPKEKREKVIALLNQTLATTTDLRTQVKQAHWNVKGEEFYQLHLLFDEIAEHLEAFADKVAERAVALGGYAKGTARMAVAGSEIEEYPTDAIDGLEHVRALVDRVGKYANHTRKAVHTTDDWGDLSTSDLYTEITRQMDKDLWFLEAHLQGRDSRVGGGEQASRD